MEKLKHSLQGWLAKANEIDDIKDTIHSSREPALRVPFFYAEWAQKAVDIQCANGYN
jgi:hypothetical protein